MLPDSHCHIDFPELAGQLQAPRERYTIIDLESLSTLCGLEKSRIFRKGIDYGLRKR